MPLQAITNSMSLAEAAGCWDEWLMFFNECYDAAQENSAQSKQIWAAFIRAYHAAHDGYLLTDRAALHLLEQEAASLPDCPFEEGSEAASIWSALQWATVIRDHRSIRELSLRLTTLSMHSAPKPQRVRRPRQDDEL
jgi:hypothetical protein